MTELIQALDLSPLSDLTADDEAWLSRLQLHLNASEHVIRFGDAEARDDGEDFVISRDRFGKWWTGRYVGDISFEGRRLEIRPRLGETVIEQWLSEILNLVAVPDTAANSRSQSFLARLMGVIWCRAVAEASRHGPPAFRRAHPHHGEFVRGRLDVHGSVRLRASGLPQVASVETFRDLTNEVSRTLIAAEHVLSSRIGHSTWHTPRVRQIVPQLREAVGSHPKLPTRHQLRQVRYSPITRRYRDLANLSWRIAQLQGLSATSSSGKAEGLLLDVAEVWELFLVKVISAAFPEQRVEHGTRTGESPWLLSSASHAGVGLGRLKPDVLVFDHEAPVLVADAKYKRVHDSHPERPRGVDRADLYQLTSYLSRYSSEGSANGCLLYPLDPDDKRPSTAADRGPWLLQNNSNVRFLRVPVSFSDAVIELRTQYATAAIR